MNRELAYITIRVFAQIVIGLVVWEILGGASLAQFMVALLAAEVATMAIFFMEDRKHAKKPVTKKASATFSLALFAMCSVLIISSFIVHLDRYTFNGLLYALAISYSIIFFVWTSWKVQKRGESANRSLGKNVAGKNHKTLAWLLIAVMIVLLVTLVILLGYVSPVGPHLIPSMDPRLLLFLLAVVIFIQYVSWKQKHEKIKTES